jgi:hypothetical protein
MRRSCGSTRKTKGIRHSDFAFEEISRDLDQQIGRGFSVQLVDTGSYFPGIEIPSPPHSPKKREMSRLDSSPIVDDIHRVTR